MTLTRTNSYMDFASNKNAFDSAIFVNGSLEPVNVDAIITVGTRTYKMLLKTFQTYPKDLHSMIFQSQDDLTEYFQIWKDTDTFQDDQLTFEDITVLNDDTVNKHLTVSIGTGSQMKKTTFVYS